MLRMKVGNTRSPYSSRDLKKYIYDLRLSSTDYVRQAIIIINVFCSSLADVFSESYSYPSSLTKTVEGDFGPTLERVDLD